MSKKIFAFAVKTIYEMTIPDDCDLSEQQIDGFLDDADPENIAWHASSDTPIELSKDNKEWEGEVSVVSSSFTMFTDPTDSEKRIWHFFESIDEKGESVIIGKGGDDV
jgi:hypothetical protein